VIQGFQPQQTLPANPPQPPAAGAPPFTIPPLKVNPPSNPLQAIHPPAVPPMAAVPVPAVGNPNKKLIILLAVLGLLAILLIVLVVLTLKK
jgi:hypothetical protein